MDIYLDIKEFLQKKLSSFNLSNNKGTYKGAYLLGHNYYWFLIFLNIFKTNFLMHFFRNQIKNYRLFEV